jgi:hypothetical protein
VFLVKKDSAITPEDILSKPVKLGVQRGTSEAEAIKSEQKEKGYTFELRAYDSAPLAVEDLLNGRIDAALMDSLPAKNAIATGRDVKICGTHGVPDDFGVAVRKEDAELKKLINEGYKKLMADPYWEELQKKYGQFHFDKETGRAMTDDGNNDLVFFERNDKQFMRTTIVTFDKEHEAPVVSYREFEHSLIKPRLRNYAVAKKE